MKHMLIGLALLLSATLFAQEEHFFTPGFQHLADRKTEFKRRYTYDRDVASIEDFHNDLLVHEAVISGAEDLLEINAFSFYAFMRASKNYYKDYFEKLSGVFWFYTQGKLQSQMYCVGNRLKYIQIWDAENREVLINGNGHFVYTTKDDQEVMHEYFRDSIRTLHIGVRDWKRDTIYYTLDKEPIPAGGMAKFLNTIQNSLKYPSLARITGKEGKVYIQFIVDKRGRLLEFKPLTDYAYSFEEKVISMLEKLPAWDPGVYNNKSVKTKVVLPINFTLY